MMECRAPLSCDTCFFSHMTLFYLFGCRTWRSEGTLLSPYSPYSRSLQTLFNHTNWLCLKNERIHDHFASICKSVNHGQYNLRQSHSRSNYITCSPDGSKNISYDRHCYIGSVPLPFFSKLLEKSNQIKSIYGPSFWRKALTTGS